MEYINDAYFINNKDKELFFEEFTDAIAHLFGIGDLDDLEPRAREMIETAIKNLFYVFDSNDEAKLTKAKLEAGFNLILPENKRDQLKIIHEPLELKTALEIFKKIDVEQTGAWTLEHFEKFLKKYVKTKKDLKKFARMLYQDADQNSSGVVSKYEFINWKESKGYKHLINVLEGKGIPYSLDDSPRSFEDDHESNSFQKPVFTDENEDGDKNQAFSDIFTNKHRFDLRDELDAFSDSQKITDFSEFFSSVDFRSAIVEINKLAASSHLSSVYPLDLINYMYQVLKNYKEGFRENDFINFMFTYQKHEKLTAYQRKIRESAFKRIFSIIDVDKNGIADYIELSECLVFLWGGSIEEKIESAFSLFDVDDTKTFTFDEFTDFLGVTFRVFLNFLCQKNPYYKQLDYRELTEQTADKCFSDLHKSPAGEISHHDLLWWVTGTNKFISKKKERILERYKPPLKATLIKNKNELKSKLLKKFLNNENLIAKINYYREMTLLYQIHFYDAIEAFKAADLTGFLNRHDFGKILQTLLVEHKIMDSSMWDYMHFKCCKAGGDNFKVKYKSLKDNSDFCNTIKSIEDSIATIFRIFDYNQTGIVEVGDIAIGCSLLCKGSIGDRIKILFEFEEITFETLEKYFFCIFSICFEARNDIHLEFDIDKLAKATAENWFDTTVLKNTE